MSNMLHQQDKVTLSGLAPFIESDRHVKFSMNIHFSAKN